ncbi:hypothetical protein QYF61_010461 [Mycteria americana]|uniref:RNase H type-1 domain-containing protein n=1 Tax=Mycteria americana TaxID=33587 RepID=A0AAN7MY42_MYCAM|nr:hypothetical protein QYF61_010461 [Mycteria americana]
MLSFVYHWNKKVRNCLCSNGKVQSLEEKSKCAGPCYPRDLRTALPCSVDDILIGTASEQECKRATINLLNFLGLAGYRVSQKKAQIVQTTVEYLGFEVSQGKRLVNTSAQKAEIAALSRVLELSENMRVNIYMDSKYAFGVIHAHGAVWKERGLLCGQGTLIKHGKAILELLQAVLKPKEVSKGQMYIISGNQKVDETAKRVALTDSKVGALIPTRRILLDPPTYSEKDNQLAKLLNCTKTRGGWWTTDTG